MTMVLSENSTEDNGTTEWSVDSIGDHGVLQ